MCSFCHFCAGFAKSHACHCGLNRLAKTILGFKIVTQYESIKHIYKSRETNRDRDNKKRVRKRHRKRDCERMHRINMRNQKLYIFAVIIAVLLAKWKTKYHRWERGKKTRAHIQPTKNNKLDNDYDEQKIKCYKFLYKSRSSQ